MSSRVFVFLFLAAAASAQAAPGTPKIDNDFVHKQFSDSCNLEPQWQPVTGDLNSDGVEDLVFVARCKNPLIDADENNYRVVDPMDAFYGYGNVKITSEMGQNDPRLHGLCIMVIHGSGPDGWHGASSAGKFVIINLAVKTITVKKMKLNKKKSTNAIYVEEESGDNMTAAIFWDGKKYRYEPLGAGME